MPIIGKTLEENLTHLIIPKNNAKIGKLKTLFRHMLMAARMNTGASALMVGKNKNTTLLIIKYMAVDKVNLVKNHIVLITIQI